jgi:hypothetical protein
MAHVAGCAVNDEPEEECTCEDMFGIESRIEEAGDDD